MTRRKLPIGIQTFREMREENYYYVDKTAYIQRLMDEGKHYFLSRPRRFGKSLFLDTLKELFEGNEPLFKGLYIHDRWDWSSALSRCALELWQRQLQRIGRSAGEPPGPIGRHRTSEPGWLLGPRQYRVRFAYLIEALHERAGQPVAVLVDEYDKPILDALDEPEIARANRDFLRGLYATIKDSDAHIKFTFLTGVSKFSKVSLFSGLNNLKDITHGCAITQPSAATPMLTWTRCSRQNCPDLDRDQIREWYNGYSLVGRGEGL